MDWKRTLFVVLLACLIILMNQPLIILIITHVPQITVLSTIIFKTCRIITLIPKIN